MSNESPDSPTPDAADPTNGARIERIERDDAGTLIVRLRGQDEPILDAKVARCFPWSVPGRYISVRNSEGKEVALLETLADLDKKSRAVVEQELRDRAFNPKILSVLKNKREFGVTSITVQTDRGEATFQIRSRDDVRVLSATRALFRDADGIIYELPDLTQLDPASYKRLQQYF